MKHTAYQAQMIREALQVHDEECCTESRPCTLRTGLEAQLGSDLKADVSAPERTGHGNRSGSRSQGPTDSQMKFVRSLLDEIHGLLGKLDKIDRTELANLVPEKLSPAVESISDRKEMSPMIDRLKGMRDHFRGQLGNARKTKPAPSRIQDGMYIIDGDVYKVVTSQTSGKPYANKLEGSSFEYAPGAIRKLRPEHLMTLEDAKKYGKLYGVCCVCGRTLTNSKSIESGIGPICAEKF